MTSERIPLCPYDGGLCSDATMSGGLMIAPCNNCLRAVRPGVCAMDADPSGLDAHAPGAKLDAGKNKLGLVLGDFARALQAVGEVGTYGANKYSEGGWLHVENGIDRYTDAMLRHYFAEASGEERDPESQLMHAAHAAWNAVARLDLLLREKERA